MRDELGVYLKILRSTMVELINKDYADFVHLSSSLIGLDKSIDNLQTLLGQLKKEVLEVVQYLDSECAEFSNTLEKQNNMRDWQERLKSLAFLYKTMLRLFKIIASYDASDAYIEVAILQCRVLE